MSKINLLIANVKNKLDDLKYVVKETVNVLHAYATSYNDEDVIKFMEAINLQLSKLQLSDLHYIMIASITYMKEPQDTVKNILGASLDKITHDETISYEQKLGKKIKLLKYECSLVESSDNFTKGINGLRYEFGSDNLWIHYSLTDKKLSNVQKLMSDMLAIVNNKLDTTIAIKNYCQNHLNEKEYEIFPEVLIIEILSYNDDATPNTDLIGDESCLC